MRIYRCWIDDDPAVGSELTLSPEESRHLSSVRRAKTGDPVLLINGRGKEWMAEITEAAKKHTAVRIQSIARETPAPARQIQLCCAMTRTNAFEELIERAVELGATAIRPILTERTVVNWDEKKSAAKLERWNRLAAEALKQCERLWLPRIEEPQPILKLIDELRVKSVKAIVLAERAVNVPPIISIAAEHDKESLAILVGPEGGWSDGERQLFSQHDLQLASLGHEAILRSETAALAALAIIAQ